MTRDFCFHIEMSMIYSCDLFCVSADDFLCRQLVLIMSFFVYHNNYLQLIFIILEQLLDPSADDESECAGEASVVLLEGGNLAYSRKTGGRQVRRVVVVGPQRVCPSKPAPLRKSKELAGECHRSSGLLMLCCVLMCVSAGQWAIMCVRLWVPVLQCVHTSLTESSILFR